MSSLRNPQHCKDSGRRFNRNQERTDPNPWHRIPLLPRLRGAFLRLRSQQDHRRILPGKSSREEEIARRSHREPWPTPGHRKNRGRQQPLHPLRQSPSVSLTFPKGRLSYRTQSHSFVKRANGACVDKQTASNAQSRPALAGEECEFLCVSASLRCRPLPIQSRLGAIRPTHTAGLFGCFPNTRLDNISPPST